MKKGAQHTRPPTASHTFCPYQESDKGTPVFPQHCAFKTKLVIVIWLDIDAMLLGSATRATLIGLQLTALGLKES